MPAGVTLALATFCNLASPVITGILFEILTGGQPFSQYPKYLAVLGTLYIVEPLLTRVYINNACAAGEKASLAARRSCATDSSSAFSVSVKCCVAISHQCYATCANACELILLIYLPFTPHYSLLLYHHQSILAYTLSHSAYTSLRFESHILETPSSATVFPLVAWSKLSCQLSIAYSQVDCGTQVLAALRLELFRTLLLQKVEFFDRHNTTQLTSLLSVELDNVRSFVFGNVSRDRGLRAILEASGSVMVLFVLSWRLGPVMGLVIISTAVTAALYRQQTKEIEKRNSKALSHMVGVADQAFSAIRTVRSASWRRTHVMNTACNLLRPSSQVLLVM